MKLFAKDGIRGVVINLATGNPIRKVKWFDTVTGEYEAFRTGADGKILFEDGFPVSYLGKSQLKFIPGKSVTPNGIVQPEPRRKLVIPQFCEKCCKCARSATWAVSDEKQLEPRRVGSVFYEQAEHVGTRYYCSWHYEPPRLLDDRGETIKEIDVKARPQ